MIVRTFRIDGPTIQLDKEPSIMVLQPDATMQPTPQDDQLTSKHRVLGIKPQLRLKWRGQDGENEIEQPDHSANLGDSITASTRIMFSVHTAATRTTERSARPFRPRTAISRRCDMRDTRASRLNNASDAPLDFCEFGLLHCKN
jgi:hypothetical protein